ncbi:MAG: DUF2384 domain-containing protein [Sphingobacteriaceae bacterium]|nr:MAG: DUF2384 domain-containing protein [Sphingobacteriaceae bacterium]
MDKKEISSDKHTVSSKVSSKGKVAASYTKSRISNRSLVNESIIAYHSLYANPISLLNSSKKGLDAKAALDFITLSGFTQEQFQDIFKTTIKTIQNYTRSALKLDAALSEKLLKSFALFEKGIELFGSAEAFNNWLHMPAFGLGNQVPVEMMDTITGIGLIEEELIRIAYGDLA